MIPEHEVPSLRGTPGNIAFFLLNLDGGGAERAIVALAGDIAKRGHVVDLVVGDAGGDYRSEVSPQVRVVDFRCRSPFTVFLRLIAYLRHRKPSVVMSALDTANILLLVAAKAVGQRRTIISQRAVVAASQSELARGRRFLTRFLQRICFRQATALICNSLAAAKDVRMTLSVPPDRVVTIPNAVDVDRINELASEPIRDPFVHAQRVPLIVSVGSFTERKDLGTLVKAFQMVRTHRPASLVIVGKGPQRPKIEELVANLGISENVYFPGFDANPYKWMAAAAVFVSSSTGEGFPNVIAEALALGRPIVATDCPGDTAELLGYGKWGRLVPVGDPERMAEAIHDALDDPAPPNGRVRAGDFSPSKITSAYLNVLLPTTARETDVMRRTV